MERRSRRKRRAEKRLRASPVDSSDRESLRQRIENTIHLHFRESAEFALKLDSGDRLNLLQVERPGFQEWLGNRKFPTIATQRSCVEKNGDGVKFFNRRPCR